MPDARSHRNPVPKPHDHAAPLSPVGHAFAVRQGAHTWLFQWTVGDAANLVQHIARMARDPDSPMDWPTAAIACKHIARLANPSASA